MPPLKYTAEELEEALFGDEGYFATKDKEREDREMVYMSISDLCTYLDISSSTWNNYKKREGYLETIKKAELQIKSEWLKNLFFPGRNATGAMFYLKNMFNFTDVGKPNKSGQLEKAQGEALKNISDALLQQMKHQLEGKTLEDEIVDVTPDDRDNKEG